MCVCVCAYVFAHVRAFVSAYLHMPVCVHVIRLDELSQIIVPNIVYRVLKTDCQDDMYSPLSTCLLVFERHADQKVQQSEDEEENHE